MRSFLNLSIQSYNYPIKEHKIRITVLFFSVKWSSHRYYSDKLKMLIISYLVGICTAVINEDRQMLMYKTFNTIIRPYDKISLIKKEMIQKCFNGIISQNMHNIISHRCVKTIWMYKNYVKVLWNKLNRSYQGYSIKVILHGTIWTVSNGRGLMVQHQHPL